MRKHGIGKLNDNSELFADLPSFNKLVIGGSVFPQEDKTTWVSPATTPETRLTTST